MLNSFFTVVKKAAWTCHHTGNFVISRKPKLNLHIFIKQKLFFLLILPSIQIQRVNEAKTFIIKSLFQCFAHSGEKMGRIFHCTNVHIKKTQAANIS